MISLLITWVIAVIPIWLAHSLRSMTLKILAGFFGIAMGIYQISLDPDMWLYIISGVIVIFIGLYVMIMVAYDYVNSRG
jgi:hypothetical protein